MARGRGAFNNSDRFGDSPRGSPRGGGRGRGGRGDKDRGLGPQRGRGRGRGGPPAMTANGVDVVVQMWPTYHSSQIPGASRLGQGQQRGGRGGFSRGRGPGSTSGEATPKRQYRGFGYSGNAYTSLSKLLDRDRPFLKPIDFVPSTLTPTLFKEEEEILQPTHEHPVGGDPAPTAGRVMRVFSGQPGFDFTDESPFPVPRVEVEEEVEVVDFEDLGRIHEEMTHTIETTTDIQAVFGANNANLTRIVTTASLEGRQVTTYASTAEEEDVAGFSIDTNPADASIGSELAVHFDRVGLDTPFGTAKSGDDPEDEEIIVYEAPNPPSGRVSLRPPASSTPQATIAIIDYAVAVPFQGLNAHATGSTPAALGTQQLASTSATDFDSLSFSFPSTSTTGPARRSGKKHAVKERRLAQRRVKRETRGTFSFLGASVADEQERRTGPERDPRREEQRRGDSDVDWGESLEENEAEIDSGMDVDADLDPEAFLRGMMRGGGQWTTMDDLQDEARMRTEDQEGDVERSGSSGEDDEGEEELLLANQQIIIGKDSIDIEVTEQDEDDDEGEDDDNEDASDDHDSDDDGSFQARLQRLRERSRGKRNADLVFDEDRDDEDDLDDQIFGPWEDDDDDLYLATIKSFLEENGRTTAEYSGQPKRQQKRFNAVRDGLLDVEFLPAQRGKHRSVPEPLREQWEKDRAKKAQRKQDRERARIAVAVDPMASKKGGRKGKKAMLVAASLDPTAGDLPSHLVHDMISLEREIRRFVADIGGKASMSLPPQDKATRKKVHELALSFGLKSVSKGKGNSRYTTLIRTTRTGMMIDEKKIARLVKRGDSGGSGKRGSGGGAHAPRPRDGDEVGKAAPKIGESNVGFKMLAYMGWAEGSRIGLSEGLDAPLVAIIKNTKLGLGATR